jgi:hypothetical protein
MSSKTKHSSDIYSRIDVAEMMLRSFYLPVDILKHPDYHVEPIQVITGKCFEAFYDSNEFVHCLESYDICASAKFVAISSRKSKMTNKWVHVAKVWYGERA